MAKRARRSEVLRLARHSAGAALLALTLATPAGASPVPFGAQQVISTAAEGVLSVFAADVDGDGDLDALSASLLDNKVAWYENTDGAGSFGVQRVIASGGNNVRAVFAADLDGDADLDVLATRHHNTIAWYENTDGAGSFGAAQLITVLLGGANGIFAADVDGDGDLDALAASGMDDKIAWYENRLDEVWNDLGPERVITTNADDAKSVFAADLDRDGDVDALSASNIDHKIAWYENTDAAGGFGSQQRISTAAFFAWSVFAADVDGDADLDVLSASAGSGGKIAWYENLDGEGGFDAQQVISTAAAHARAVFGADVDGDGDVDALSASLTDNKIAWYENTDGAGNFGAQQVITTAADGGWSVFAADMDGDGDGDVLSASTNDDKVAWYPNETIHRSALYPDRTAISTNTDGVAVAVADLDRDGAPDLVTAGALDDEVAWHAGDGAGGFGAKQTISTSVDNPLSVAVADLDGDGDPDVLSASLLDDKVAWYENTDGAGSFGPQQVISTAGDGPTAVAVTDADQDGDLDVVATSFNDHEVSVYANRLDEVSNDFAPQLVLSTAGQGPAALAMGDIGGLGGALPVVASHTDDTVAWIDPFGVQQVIATGADGARSVAVADVDRDGDLDVLAASEFDDTVAWYENVNGTGFSWTQHVLTTGAAEAQSVFATDLDRDGDVDVVAASAMDDAVRWFESDGASPPSFAAHVITTGADGASAVAAADLDRDGDADVVSASQGDDTLAWYENQGGQYRLESADVAPAVLGEGSKEAILALLVTHRGRAADSDIELARLFVRFTDGPGGSPLTLAEVNALIDTFSVHRDDGDGIFEGTDTLVASVGPFGQIINGIGQVFPPDGAASAAIAPGETVRFFLAVELTVDAHSQTPNSFALTHLLSSTDTADDRSADVPVTPEPASDVTSGAVLAVGETLCTDGLDDDGDGLTDCADPSCASHPACSEAICDDGLDDDGNGFTDCSDFACQQDPFCTAGEAFCTDGVDNDGDAFTDCADLECAGHVACGETACSDALDNDGNGFTDCADFACQQSPLCAETACTDGLDNDSNGFTDCADFACQHLPACASESSCTNDADDDGDGLTDCTDPDCASHLGCEERVCNDSVDNDGNGFTDCGDFACEHDPACAETICTDGIDNDGNGFKDCEDNACLQQQVCTGESFCTNGLDDDGDTLTDCADPHCAADPACAEAVCNDGVDDDGNGFTDCADFACQYDPLCTTGEAFCTDGLDNDGDAFTDCADLDCASHAACAETACSDAVDNDANGFTDCADFACQNDPLCAAAAVPAAGTLTRALLAALLVLAAALHTRKVRS